MSFLTRRDSLIIALISASLLVGSCRGTYSIDKVAPEALRDIGWSALESPRNVSWCPGIEVDVIRDNPSLMNGGDLLTLKRSWCATRHVQIFVTHYRTDSEAWIRMRPWNGEDAKRIHSGSESRFDDIALRDNGVSSFQGREWSMCTARFRMGNYLLDYRLDVSGEPKTCGAMARRDVESMREAIDTWMKSGQAPLSPN